MDKWATAGPDGISNGIFKYLRNVGPTIFLELINGIIDGKEQVNGDFNYAIMCCIPKTVGETSAEGEAAHTADATRPISIVDGANRILAAILKVALERCIGEKISEMQRGFLQNRSMLSNIIDIDFAAQKISIKSCRGALLLFDFRAAFPSMNHDFIWDTLNSVGLPEQYVAAIREFYKQNVHYIKLLFPGPEVKSGVRQGCPLSGLLFAICADVLLTKMREVLCNEDEIGRAFADDTAAVVNDYIKTIPVLARLFEEYEQISGLALNIKKTVFIPLWPHNSECGLRNLIRELCPAWRNVKIASKAKYLGFVIGPGARDDSWEAPTTKYMKRISSWEDMQCGMLWNSMFYNIFAVTTLEFVAQLEDVPDSVLKVEEWALRRLAPGPGNWISPEDLENLDKFGIGNGFRLLRHTHRAAKLRVIKELGQSYIRKIQDELTMEQCSFFSRPFGTWHNRAYVTRLWESELALRDVGITIRGMLSNMTGCGGANFQRKRGSRL